jgi:serine/threonine-protein kinase
LSLWDKVRGLLAGELDEGEPKPDGAPPPDAPPIAPAPPAAVDVVVARLRELGRADGPAVDEAIALLRRAKGTSREAAAVGAALEAAGARPVPEDVRVACAEILATRGEEGDALRALEGVLGVPGLVLAADLAASTGDLARAVGTIERVLARDLGTPGAVERHRRWTAALGGVAAQRRPKDEATIVAATPRGGPFRVLREVARGGAGAVYEADDEALGRRLAFKVYHRREADRAALEREVAATTALAGAGVVRVFDAAPGEGWIAFEWAPLGSVRDVLRAGAIDALRPVGRWAVPLAAALARVHARGWVHADVKPANVLLRHPAEPVLADFGLARVVGAPSEGGSAGYLSPERLAGRASDPRDDVYGYGRVLEDVLARLEAAGSDAGQLAAWRAVALACIGPDARRPPDGAAVLRASRSVE